MKKKKINIVDMGVILLIILVILAVHIRFKKYNTADTADATLEKIVYEVRFSNVRDYTVNAFQVGDSVFDSQTNVEIGKIINKTSKEYESDTTLRDGTIVKRMHPERYELVLEIESDGIVNNSGYYVNKTVELKVGSEKAVETLYAKSTGRIISISIGGE